MFYQYRQLTPEEREQIVQLRRERGYPLHAPPHPYRDAGTFLITGANYEHKPIMDNPLRRTEFELQLLDVLRGIQVRNEDHFYRALNYVHVNPVKHGYVRDPYDWLWTSLENYRTNLGRDWLRENWKLHPPGDFGKGWDD